MKQALISILLILIIVASECNGANIDSLAAKKKKTFRNALAPEYFPIQFAGNIGFLSAGVGFRNRTDNYQLSIVYGYVPRSHSLVDSHLLTAKNTFHLFHYRISERETLFPYGSVGISWEIGGRSFFTQPENMPRGYYDFPKSVHAIPSMGLKYRRDGGRLKAFQGVEFFVEITSVDAYIWYKFLSDDLKMHQILSGACGVQLLCR
jgi:hypothetical protein